MFFPSVLAMIAVRRGPLDLGLHSENIERSYATDLPSKREYRMSWARELKSACFQFLSRTPLLLACCKINLHEIGNATVFVEPDCFKNQRLRCFSFELGE